MIYVAETTHVLGPTAWLKVGWHGACRCWGWRRRCRGGQGGRRRRGARACGRTSGDGFDTIRIPEHQISAIGIESRVQCKELGRSQIKFCFH
jgi:hypothetical protein